MHYPNRPLRGVDGSAQVHDTARIIGHEYADTSRIDIGELSRGDTLGNTWLFERKRSAEAAADTGLVHLDDVVPKDVGKKLARLGLESQTIVGLTGVVNGHIGPARSHES